ncbi:MVP [Lepeophtheirus salmonis]|uniref:MVP n=1 Tax=Lepeophtheirus salmonis TaxID=72036 RepID=A0A7R8CET0_LEPSM|nr:MVP [Lepeophtheirus salmonis]CAF2798434.1 MVP [Lepeophtheirus salmonis]
MHVVDQNTNVTSVETGPQTYHVKEHDKPGAYLPLAYENVFYDVRAHIPQTDVAILVKANASFKDTFGVERKNGDQGLITLERIYIILHTRCSRSCKILGTVEATTLDSRHYCTILNPYGSDGKPMLGHRAKLSKGKSHFS